MRITHLNGLKALEATLRTGSFRAAASELGVTAAAVGQQIRSLEEFLGQPMFERASTGVRPASPAQEIEQKLSACFATLGEVIGQLEHRPAGNRLAISLPSSFAENWFTARLPGFYRLNSEIDLRLDASNRMVDLIREDFDFVIRYSLPAPEIYNEKILFGDHVLPVCSPGFAKQHRLSRNLDSLAGVPLIHVIGRTPDPQWADWETWAETFGFRPDGMSGGVRLTQFSSGMRSAIGGQGLVLCGIVEAYDAIREGLLIMPFGPELNCPAGYRYRLVSISGRRMSKLQIQFQDWVMETARDFEARLGELFGENRG
jgi:LysR family glycine cleavage system transcriptional activator